jgi:hypothetical protein
LEKLDYNSFAEKCIDDFGAWCSQCEIERQKEDGWNDTSEAFANIKVVCEDCYFEMKELNLGHK